MRIYKAWAINDQGATSDVGDGCSFSSIRKAEQTARGEFAKGWKIHIIDNNTGEEVKVFKIRGVKE